MKNNSNKDFSGQVTQVTVSTRTNVQDRKLRKISVDRTGDALRNALPPIPFSQRTKAQKAIKGEGKQRHGK